jgi:hypothetical protein
MAETVGSLVDKISIMGLKAYHMELQTHRIDVNQSHNEKCQKKLKILMEQKQDLAQELTELLDGLISGEKKLKVYRQFKMYNDPIYKKGS